ncbi:MAG: hypothetical protein JWN50_305 [Parcubacteria group bacterium]|nr:hypothetical protein [Parcubacteria group bacterium]
MRSLLRKTFLLAFLLSIIPAFASADTLSLTPTSGAYSPGKTIPVTVFVSSLSQSVNAVSGTVTFPTDKLQVVSVSKTGSVLSLWVSDPTFSNTAGTVSFEGVVPNPGYIGPSGKIVTINFKVVGQGTATVKWSAGSVLANDGSGTNILKNLNTATYTLGSSPVPDVAPVVAIPAPTVAVPPKTGGILVTSSTFLDQKSWYAATSGTFKWKLNDNVTAVRVLVGRLPDSTPTVVYEPPIDEKNITNLDDGVWYFHIQGKTSTGWGTITHYQFRVDSTPPESFDIKALASSDQTDPKPKFAFDASDSTSGIDHYTVAIDSGAPVVWHDDGSGVYAPPVLGPGSHTILAKAYDAAGNSIPASVDFTVTSIESPKITSFTQNVKSTAPLVVRGTAQPGTKVEITLTKSGLSKLVSAADAATDGPVVESVNCGTDGAFNISIDTNKLPSGSYDLNAVSVDSRGARSQPSASETVLVNASWLQSLGSSLLSTLAVAVPVIALLILLVLALMHGFHRVRMTNKKFRAELDGVERLVDKAFALLKEDVEDSIRLLERTKSRRRLTGEEDAIIERLRANLKDAEKVIHGQVKKIEREID